MRHWTEYRNKELAEKAGMVDFPKYDMDGSLFDPGDCMEEDDMFDSTSIRMGLFEGTFDPRDHTGRRA